MHPGEMSTRTVAPLIAAQAAPATAEPPPPDQRGLRRIRWAVAAIMAALVGLAAFRLSFVEGLLQPATIEGPSMAPALVGPHFAVSCADCGLAFACDAEHPPSGGQAVCPNCGYEKNDLGRASPRPAEHVLIDRWRLIWRGAGRGEIVAARLPGQRGDLVVKRIAALPGERLAIRDGDLYANQQLLRKSPAELRAVRVLVHDNDHQPQVTAGLPPRWQGAAADSRWRPTAAGFAAAADGAAGEIDWLAYRHWPCAGHPLVARTKTDLVRDLDAFNQGDNNRELLPVHDVQLTCRLLARGEGTLGLAAVDRGQRLVVLIDSAARRLAALSDSRLLSEDKLPSNLFRQTVELQFGLCDQQVLLVIDGRTLLCLPYDRAAGTPAPGGSPLEIGVRGLSVEVSRLNVWRDIHYLSPSGLAQPWQAAAALGPSQVALLGDNPAVSIDSRQWQAAGVPAGSLLGRVYRPFWSAR